MLLEYFALLAICIIGFVIVLLLLLWTATKI
jgi:hypothetical protein